MYRRIASHYLVTMAAALTLAAQTPVKPVGPGGAPAPAPSATNAIPGGTESADKTVTPAAPIKTQPERVADYVLGPEDQIIIRAFQAEEFTDKPIAIAGDGYISLPMIGRVKAGGLTVQQLEEEIVKRLGAYILHPQVTVLVSEYHSEPVSVVGAVGNPGVVQLKGRRSLVEVIALAGGLKQEAGNTVTITRELSQGRVPVPDAKDDSTGRYSIAHLNLHGVMNAKNPQGNILVEPNDVIMIPRAQMVYVVGEVERPGGYELNQRDTISLLESLSLAGGLKPTASAKKARILREDEDHTKRTEMACNLKKIMSGDAPDMQLRPDDILFVPDSKPKAAGAQALQTALNMAGIAIWKF